MAFLMAGTITILLDGRASFEHHFMHSRSLERRKLPNCIK